MLACNQAEAPSESASLDGTLPKSDIKFPLISIVIPSYNKAPYLAHTLNSICTQRYPNFEVIIQDGGSTDGSEEIIKDFAGKYPKIIRWVSQKDNGQVDAINTGLQKAKGEILAYINADDVYYQGAFLSVGKVFLEEPETLWVTGYGDIIDNQGRKISSLVTIYKNIFLRLNLPFFLLVFNYITQPATFFSRKAYLKHGPFSGTRNYVMEYDLWLKLSKLSMPRVIRRNLASFRLTTDNISATSFNDLLALDYGIARKYTGNYLILVFHYLHNLARIGLIRVIKGNSFIII